MFSCYHVDLGPRLKGLKKDPGNNSLVFEVARWSWQFELGNAKPACQYQSHILTQPGFLPGSIDIAIIFAVWCQEVLSPLCWGVMKPDILSNKQCLCIKGLTNQWWLWKSSGYFPSAKHRAKIVLHPEKPEKPGAADDIVSLMGGFILQWLVRQCTSAS